MSQPGGSDLRVEVRRALLDALTSLDAHQAAVIVVGAQAIYLHTGDAPVALAEATKDSDLALDPRHLRDDPRVEAAMRAGGFLPAVNGQPGAWVDRNGIPVDLMVPEALAGGHGKRSAEIPPHDKKATRRTVGLEAALVDHAPMPIAALDPNDRRTVTAQVAGPAALLVAKLHKLGERQAEPHRLQNKDAHDVYRLLVTFQTKELASVLRWLLADPLSGDVTERALGYLGEMFASGPEAVGSTLAGRAEELVGEPATVAASVAALAEDLIKAMEH